MSSTDPMPEARGRQPSTCAQFSSSNCMAVLVLVLGQQEASEMPKMKPLGYILNMF